MMMKAGYIHVCTVYMDADLTTNTKKEESIELSSETR